MTDERRYGLYPQQVQGIDATSRPFYFCARAEDWELWRGPVGAEADYPTWADRKQLVAEGRHTGLTPDDIDRLLALHLGRGWTLAGDGLLDVLGAEIWPLLTDRSPITKSERERALGYDSASGM